MTALVGSLDRKIRPYTRRGTQRFTSAAWGKYDKDQKVLALELFACVLQQRAASARRLVLDVAQQAGVHPHKLLAPGTLPLVRAPYLFGLRIGCPTTKKGALPKNEGDFDNFVKAFLDALQRGRVVDGDSLYHYRGPCAVVPSCPDTPSVVPSPNWWFAWRLLPLPP